ncbi:MAG: ATP-binding cassette domain-containing protein, partial [Bacilli bacterium]|nr:ATP-binding cassette domain-containing protein [Bacilli bacterium]
MIRIRKLTKVFDGVEKTVACNNIDYDFASNGLYAIIGPSGCGKSTFLRILSGIETKYEGSIYFDRTNLKMLNGKKRDAFRQNMISYSSQKLDFVPYLSIKENLYLSLGKDKKVEIDYYLKELEIDTSSPRCIHLSKGEMSRLVFIRALLSEAPILLLDEPIGSVDERLAHKMMNILKKESMHRLIILVTHIYEKYNDIYD